MRGLCLTILLIATVGNAAEVYRWVDDSGQVHYSDRPREGAERVEIREPQTINPPVRTRSGPVAEDTAGDESFSYQTLEITSPGQEEVLWNIGGQLDVSMRLQPRLQRGHSLELYLDGQPVELPRRNSLQATLTDVFRGVHVLRAQVTGPDGDVLIESQPRTFVVQQTSIANPNNPNRPLVPTPRPGGAN